MAQKKTTARKSDNTAATALAVGAGVAAVTAAAYLMFGPDAKKNRRIVRGWAVKMRGEMIEKLENAKEISEPVYHKIVDEVSSKYAKLKNVDQAELMATVTEARKYWQHMVKSGKPARKAAPKKTTAKKPAVKKTSAKK